MGNLADTSIFQEMQEEMEDFFEYIDNEVYGQTELIHEVDGEVITEPVEDVLEREQSEIIAESAWLSHKFCVY
mgnify:CR=1 FL=1